MNNPLQEIQQKYDELCHEFEEKYSGIELPQLDEEGSNLLISCLKTKLELKRMTTSEWAFKRSHEPVIKYQIGLVENHIREYKFHKRLGVKA